jgi:uncharacterized protein (DUF2236 family)
MTPNQESRAQLEEAIARIEARTPNRRIGLYGPGSMSWTINREVMILVGGGRAALLQLAHPFVAHAVDQHSDTPTDPVGRFRRTFENVFGMVFGDLDTVLERARSVHTIHTRIQGPIEHDVGPFKRAQRYRALDQDALVWVQATLFDTATTVFDRIVQPLSTYEREAYYEETRTLASLFGIRAMPDSYAHFNTYMADMLASETITFSRPGKDLAQFLLQPPKPLYAPFTHAYKTLTAGMLNERLRGELNLRWGLRERAEFHGAWPMLKALHKRTPARLRFFPDYIEGVHRVQGSTAERDTVGRALEAAALWAIQPSTSVLERERARREGR